MDTTDTTVRVTREVMNRVLKRCDLTGHSAKSFVEECVKGCLDQIEAKESPSGAIAIVNMARQKLNIYEAYKPAHSPHLSPEALEQIRLMMREEINHSNQPQTIKKSKAAA